MKKLLFILFFLLAFFTARSQDPAPVDADFKTVSTYSIKYHLIDSTVWLYKGATYGWTKLSGDLRHWWTLLETNNFGVDTTFTRISNRDSVSMIKYRLVIDTTRLKGTATVYDLLHYRMLNNHDSLSTLDEKQHASLTNVLGAGSYHLSQSQRDSVLTAEQHGDTVRLKGHGTIYDLQVSAALKKDLNDSTDTDGYTRRDRFTTGLNTKIGGSGNANYHSKFTDKKTIGNSLLWDNGTYAAIPANPIFVLGSATPNTWFAGYQMGVLQSGLGVFAGRSQTVGGWSIFGNNTYLNSGGDWTYMINDEASMYRQINGTHSFNVAVAGAADAGITFREVLNIDNAGILWSTITNKARDITPVTGTSAVYDYFHNTGGDLTVAINSSNGEALAIGGVVYAGTIATFTNTALQFGTYGAIRQTIAANGDITFTNVISAPTISLTTGAAVNKVWQCTNATTGAGQWALVTTTQTFVSTWNATTNDPTLADGSGTTGYYHNVVVAGTQNLGSGSITFEVGDAVIYNGSIWQKLPKPIITGAALTKTDDTNITLTLGGSHSIALLNAASITAGWTGLLASTRGGSGVNNAGTLAWGNGGTLGTGAYATIANYLPLTAGVGNPLTGVLYSSVTNQARDVAPVTGTSVVYDYFHNTGGALIVGINDNTGSSLMAGGTTYASSIYNNTNTALEFGTNSILRFSIAANGYPTFTERVTMPTLKVTTGAGAGKVLLSDADGLLSYSASALGASAYHADSYFQTALVSGTSLKTVGGVNLLGSGDIGIIGSAYGGSGINNVGTLTWGAGGILGTSAYTATYVHPTTNGNIHVPASGAANQILQYSSAGTAKWVTVSGGATIADGGAVTITAITSLGGLTAATQTFAIGTTGTAPNWSSATSTHTLRIPMAATASVTAGLISKTEYDIFNGKLATNGSAASLTSFPDNWLLNSTSDIMDGTLTATDFCRTSDIRLKKNIKQIDWSKLSNLNKINWIQYTPKNEPDSVMKYGVRAQELEKILPQFVITATDSMKTKSVDYTSLLIAKALSDEIRIEKLENEIAELKKLLNYEK